MIRLSIIENEKKRFFETDKKEISLGRSIHNDIMLRNSLSSRNHCLIIERAQKVFLKDLDSRNGIRVNGKLVVNEVELSFGDVIEIGKVTAITLLSEKIGSLTAESSSSSFEEDPTQIFDISIVDEVRKIEDFRKIEEFKKQPQEKPQTSKLSLVLHEREKLLRLYEISKAMNAQLHKEKLLELIMDAAIDLTKAERGCIVLVESENIQKLEVARNLNRTDLKTEEFRVSQSIMEQVLSTGSPLVTTNAQEDSRFLSSHSVQEQQLRSILCIPFKLKSRISGIVYLDHRFAEVRFTQADIHLLEVFSEQAAIAMENARLYEEVQKKERFAFEIETASTIQQLLLPIHSPEIKGLKIVGCMSPASEVGGDYYDFIRLENDPNFLYICIGDVSGHGVAAGLIMVMVRSILHALIPHNFSTREILLQANKILSGSVPKSMFLSLNLLRWNTFSKKLTYTSAGHEYLIHYQAQKKTASAIMAGGVVLGPMKDVSAHLKETDLLLEVGDTLVLYTDGITEALSEEDEYFTLDRLRAVVKRWGHLEPQPLIERILGEVRQHIGKGEQEDDITLVVLKRTDED